MVSIVCSNCHLGYPDSGAPYVCPSCGGLFDFDEPFPFSPTNINRNAPGIWKFRHSFGFPDHSQAVSLGEGNTPLLWVSINGIKVGLKLESLNPTGSYKDRGTSTMISFLLTRGISHAVEDSSGNAGASFAAYAASAGIKARIFVPESASGPKKYQIEQYGAELVKISGPRSAASEAVLKDVKKGTSYASHAFLPFGLPGIATIAYELWESLGLAPGTIIAPVGHGGLLLGIMRGFDAIRSQNLIQSTPYYVGVQAANMSPLYAAFHNGLSAADHILEGKTIAEGVSVRRPSRLNAIIREMQPDKGTIIAIEEKDIMPAYHQLSQKGIYVEPTSALVLAALQQLAGNNIPEPIILILSGTGLKYLP